MPDAFWYLAIYLHRLLAMLKLIGIIGLGLRQVCTNFTSLHALQMTFIAYLLLFKQT